VEQVYFFIYISKASPAPREEKKPDQQLSFYQSLKFAGKCNTPTNKSVINLIPCSNSQPGSPSSQKSKGGLIFPDLSPETLTYVYGPVALPNKYANIITLFNYQNIARTRPDFIIAALKQKLNNENSSKSIYAKCIKEAIEDMQNMPVLKPLKFSSDICEVCKQSVEQAKKTPGKFIQNSENFTIRMKKLEFIKPGSELGELIFYGNSDPWEIILDMIIDGTPDREQRGQIYNPKYTIAGVAMDKYDVTGSVVVFSYSS